MLNTKSAAYQQAKSTGRINKHETAIMSCFQDARDEFSREDLSTLTDVKVSSICGAAHSLIQKGKLEVVGIGFAISGVKVQLLGLPRPSKRESYYAQAAAEAQS